MYLENVIYLSLFYVFFILSLRYKIFDDAFYVFMFFIGFYYLIEVKNPFYVMLVAFSYGFLASNIYNNPFHTYNFLFKEED